MDPITLIQFTFLGGIILHSVYKKWNRRVQFEGRFLDENQAAFGQLGFVIHDDMWRHEHRLVCATITKAEDHDLHKGPFQLTLTPVSGRSIPLSLQYRKNFKPTTQTGDRAFDLRFAIMAYAAADGALFNHEDREMLAKYLIKIEPSFIKVTLNRDGVVSVYPYLLELVERLMKRDVDQAILCNLSDHKLGVKCQNLDFLIGRELNSELAAKVETFCDHPDDRVKLKAIKALGPRGLEMMKACLAEGELVDELLDFLKVTMGGHLDSVFRDVLVMKPPVQVRLSLIDQYPDGRGPQNLSFLLDQLDGHAPVEVLILVLQRLPRDLCRAHLEQVLRLVQALNIPELNQAAVIFLDSYPRATGSYLGTVQAGLVRPYLHDLLKSANDAVCQRVLPILVDIGDRESLEAVGRFKAERVSRPMLEATEQALAKLQARIGGPEHGSLSMVVSGPAEGGLSSVEPGREGALSRAETSREGGLSEAE